MASSVRRNVALVLLLHVLVAVLVAVLVPTGKAEARPMLNPCTYDNTCITTTVRRTFEPQGLLSPGGHKATFFVHIPCAAGERFRVEVRVSQGDVTAEGFRAGTCGRRDVWPVVVTTRGDKALTEGPAQACGAAETHKNRVLTSGQSWCRMVAIVS